MSTGLNVFLAGVALAVMSLTALAAAKRPDERWNYFHFDGHGFVAGKPADDSPAVALRAGVRPVLVGKGGKPEPVSLAGHAGALVGICFSQGSGGKLKAGAGFLPYPRLPVQVFSGETMVAATQTDAEGYFLVTLPPGKYRVRARQEVEVTVENGKTTLLALRAGKRMVD